LASTPAADRKISGLADGHPAISGSWIEAPEQITLVDQIEGFNSGADECTRIVTPAVWTSCRSANSRLTQQFRRRSAGRSWPSWPVRGSSPGPGRDRHRYGHVRQQQPQLDRSRRQASLTDLVERFLDRVVQRDDRESLRSCIHHLARRPAGRDIGTWLNETN